MSIIEHLTDTPAGLSPALTPTPRYLRAVRPPLDLDGIEDALSTFGARFVEGAPTDDDADQALGAMRSWLACAEQDRFDRRAGGYEVTGRERPMACFGCGLPTGSPDGVCITCAEAALRDGETLRGAAGRVRHGDLTQAERDRLAGLS